MKDEGEPVINPAANRPLRLLAALPDTVAFGGGLAMAWCLGWKTRDLVCSLWLSSPLVGYSILGNRTK